MSLRWVQQASVRPHRCAVIPFIGNSNARKGFFDTGVDLPFNGPVSAGDRVYVSVEAVEEMARRLGWSPAHTGAQLQKELDAEKQENARQGEIIADLEAQLAAVAVLKNGTFRQQGAPGRPKKQKAVA